MNIEIDTELLGRDVSRLEEYIEKLSTTITEMYASLDNLNSMWEGNAHDVFVAETENHRTLFNNILNELQNMVACMEYASSVYDTCEGEIGSIVASINI